MIADFYRVVGERVSHKGDIEDNGVLTREEFAAHMMENPADFYYGVQMCIRDRIQHGLYALEFGDIFMRCVYATRPYEAVAGSTDELHEKLKKEVIAFITPVSYTHLDVYKRQPLSPL